MHAQSLPHKEADREADRWRYRAMLKKLLFRAFIIVLIPVSLFLSGWYLHDTVAKYNNRIEPIELTHTLNGTYRSKKNTAGENIVFIFTGRWQFLRILLPYLCRDLRQNGGVLDKVWFMMVNYDEETRAKLIEFTYLANEVYKKEVFTMHYFGYTPPNQPSKRNRFKLPYDMILPLITEYPQNKYFKLDDDIVYIHPNAFSSMIDKEVSNCLIHFFNIAGANWRCSWLHQKLGVYNAPGVNPNRLKFDYSYLAKCGWKNYECAVLTLNTFLHHYYSNSLDAYFFHDIYYLNDRKRFSINAFLFDVYTLDMGALLTSNQKSYYFFDDEKWWTSVYAANAKRVNCVIGDALVVHFSYFTNSKKLIENGYLSKFENLVHKQKNDFNISAKLWNILY